VTAEATTQLRLSLVVGAARSGTTLTRRLLDAHPEIGCPAEAGLPGLLAHMTRVWMTVHADERVRESRNDPGIGEPEPNAGEAAWARVPGTPFGQDAPNDERGAHRYGRTELPPAARAWLLDAIGVPMASYCRPRGKRLYVDKSLDSVYHLRLVQDLFPDTRTILVFRHVMDTIASGLEASPWGFQAYGYVPYVQGSVTNNVAALATYWLDHVGAALAWEREARDSCYRVLYEDLVTSPGQTVAGMQRFLGVAEDLSVLSGAFGRATVGPGDYKVDHTSGVHSRSIGHGKRVPVSMLPPGLLNAVNEHLEELGYPTLDSSWNTAERPVDSGGEGMWATQLRDLMDRVSVTPDQAIVESFAIVAEDHHRLRWVVRPREGSIRSGEGDVDGVVTGTAEDLVLLFTREENLGVLVRAGRVRYLTSNNDPNANVELLSELVDLVRSIQLFG